MRELLHAFTQISPAALFFAILEVELLDLVIDHGDFPS